MDEDKDAAGKGTLVQGAFRYGLIVVPLCLYARYVYRTFRPCPRVKYYEQTSQWKVRHTYRSRRQHVLKTQNTLDKCCRNRNTERINNLRAGSRIANRSEIHKNLHGGQFNYLRRFRMLSSGHLPPNTIKVSKGLDDDLESVVNSRTIPNKSERVVSADCTAINIPSEVLDRLWEAYYKSYKQIQEACHSKNEPQEVQPQITKMPIAHKVESCDESFYFKDPDTPFIIKQYTCKTAPNDNSFQFETRDTHSAAKQHYSDEFGTNHIKTNAAKRIFQETMKIGKKEDFQIVERDNLKTDDIIHQQKSYNDGELNKTLDNPQPCHDIVGENTSEMFAEEDIEHLQNKTQQPFIRPRRAAELRDEFWHTGMPPECLKKGCKVFSKTKNHDKTSTS